MKKYCHADIGFCFRYPASWEMLGDIFAGNGVVVAPVQKDERALWDEVTVAIVAPAKDDAQPLSLNVVIDRATAAMREAGQNFETLQRQERTVDHKPAQLLKIRYRENSTGRDWIEELVFIQGSENEVYSVALKCAPEHLARLEPAFKEVLSTWRVPSAEPPSSS